jgi:hypothetical protein
MIGSRYPEPLQVTVSLEVQRAAVFIIRAIYLQEQGITVGVYRFRKRIKQQRVYLAEIGDRVSISIKWSQCVNFLQGIILKIMAQIGWCSLHTENGHNRHYSASCDPG